MAKIRIFAVITILVGMFAGYYSYGPKEGNILGLSAKDFKFGLDLKGGTHLVYQADTSKTESKDIPGAMEALRDAIERRINVFGVSEPLVQVEETTVAGVDIQKLIVELPGVSDIDKAINTIGKTPLLEFRIEKEGLDKTATNTQFTADQVFVSTNLTGKLLKRADIEFNPNTGEPVVSLSFNDEGKKLFAEITKTNTGKILAIFLDGVPLSTPVIREEIRDGKAQISGAFSTVEAQTLVRDLNFGALPLPVTLVGSQTIGASLGEDALNASLKAGLWSFIAVSIFLLCYYRFPGLIAVLALAIYTALNLAIFKFLPVTLTSAGLAGFILSIGMAVDANILIFERMKEEIKRGLDLDSAIKEGFARAWLSIRDSNSSSIITSLILYYFATSSLIKGFALVFFIGVVVSMFTAITATRAMLMGVGISKTNAFTRFLFGNGFTK